MSEKFIWEADNRWNRLRHARDDLLGKRVEAISDEFYPLASDEKGFIFDESLDEVHALFELNAGWIRGEASVPQELAGQADLAIVVSGKVVAITATFAHHDASQYFAELLPESVSRARNVKVFVLRP